MTLSSRILLIDQLVRCLKVTCQVYSLPLTWPVGCLQVTWLVGWAKGRGRVEWEGEGEAIKTLEVCGL